MMRRRFALLAPLAFLAFACGSDDAAPESSAPPVTLAPAVAAEITDSIRATGQLIAQQEAWVAAEVGGQVTAIVIDEGQPAAEGAVVIAIDPERRALERDSARASLDEARANLAEQQRGFERVKELFERGVASQAQLDQAETSLKLARSRIAAARANLGVVGRSLRDAEVRAPFTGLVDRRFTSRGGYVKPGEQLFRLVSLSPILVVFNLTEVDSGRVRVGQKISVSVAPYPDEVFPAVVSVLSPTIDPATRTLQVKGQLPNADGRLRPGLFARIDIGVSTRSAVVMVPEDAILQRADGAIVFRISEGNRVERVVVETGVHRGGAVEIVEGIVAGDVIVRRGHSALVNGEIVTPRNPDGTLVGSGLPSVAEAATLP